MRLENQVAIITGASRGLGREIALAMAKEGALAVIMARSRGALQEVAEQIESAGGRCIPVAGDVSNQNDVRSMVDLAKSQKRIDILVNNAAILGPVSFLADTNPDAWRKTLDINLNGSFYCAKAVVPIMAEQRRGKIINIASGLGRMPFPRFSAYAASKAGLIQLTRSLSAELKAYHIQVNAIDPGVMDTSMQEQIRQLDPSLLGEELHRQFSRYKEENSLKDPAEVARLAVYLASSEADELTGRFGTLEYYERLGWTRTAKNRNP